MEDVILGELIDDPEANGVIDCETEDVVDGEPL